MPGETCSVLTLKLLTFCRCTGVQWKETTSLPAISASPLYTNVQASPRLIAASSCTNRYSPLSSTPCSLTGSLNCTTAFCFLAAFDALLTTAELLLSATANSSAKSKNRLFMIISSSDRDCGHRHGLN